MPLYEFYCQPCHMMFTFRSQRVDTVTLPTCPQCGSALKREVSPFAHSVRGAIKEGGDQAGGADRMDLLAAQLGEKLQALDDDDAEPRDAVRIMRELASAGGVCFNKDVQEAMARIEAGEDPEKIDEELREVLDAENPFLEEGSSEKKPDAETQLRLRAPLRDPKWHDM